MSDRSYEDLAKAGYDRRAGRRPHPSMRDDNDPKQDETLAKIQEVAAQTRDMEVYLEAAHKRYHRKRRFKAFLTFVVGAFGVISLLSGNMILVLLSVITVVVLMMYKVELPPTITVS